MDADDEIRILRESHYLLGDDVPTTLLSRGWVVTDLYVGDDEPLEFYWPPTAPVECGSRAEPTDEGIEKRPLMHQPRRNPWTRPTRISRAGLGWRVEYGEAIAQHPGLPLLHDDDASLVADLERIEWWPMAAEEARRIQMERVFATTVADASNDHRQAVIPTEPYATRMDALREHVRVEHDRARGLTGAEPPSAPRQPGDLRAQMRLVDAEAWASAIRTARVGEQRWSDDGSR